MKLSSIRFTIQAAMFFALVYAGMLGVRRMTVAGAELSLPLLSCEYGQRIAKCYLYDVQVQLGRGSSERYQSLLEPTAFFVILGMLVGRMWCGWGCPLGFMQELLSKLRAALGFGRIDLGRRGRRGFAVGAYSLLGLVVLTALLAGWPSSRLYRRSNDLWRPYCQTCPSRQLTPLVQGKAGNLFKIDRYSTLTAALSYTAAGLLVLFVVGSLAMRRFWCRLCPLGALMRLVRLNSLAFVSLKKDVATCTHCGNCARACPVNIEEVFAERERENVTRPECVLCLKCVESCPEDGVLRATFARMAFFRSSFDYVMRSVRRGTF